MRPPTITSSLFHSKPHLRPHNLHFKPVPASSSSSSSSSSSFTSPYTTTPTPTPPKLPPRRRPTFAAVGFGNGGSHPEASSSRRNGRRQGQSQNQTQNQNQANVVETASTSSSTQRSGIKRQAMGDTLLRPIAASSEDLVDGLQGLENPVIRVQGNEQERLTEEESEKVDGNEAEACYVPPPATLHYHHPSPLPLLYSPTPLPQFDIAYETWGTLNSTQSNAILLHTGLSASSHVASNGNDVAEETGNKKGWWEDFVGPGKSIDTDKFYVICTNVIGGCFGSTGPSSQWPHGEEGERWATRFPILSLFDMTRAQLSLLDHLGIDRLYASIGASMGGMQSLALAYQAPERVGRLASISATGRSGLNGVGMRYAQRSVLMNDPNWNRGFYYDGVPPHTGMKLARQIATITYRSGPEWEERFGRRMLSETTDEESGEIKEIGVPSLSPDFLIETYLDHQGERFCLTYDANTMIYLSKAMDLFDMTDETLILLSDKFHAAYPDDPTPFPHPNKLALSPKPIQKSKSKPAAFIPTSKSAHLRSLANGLKRLEHIPSLVLGVQSDVLFPVEQQRELADALKLGGNQRVTYYEIGGVWGHDTFLLDVQGVGGALRGFLNWED